MFVICPTCNRTYDDEHCWTICPHGPLWAAHDAYCRRHDVVNCWCKGKFPPLIAPSKLVRRWAILIALYYVVALKVLAVPLTIIICVRWLILGLILLCAIAEARRLNEKKKLGL